MLTFCNCCKEDIDFNEVALTVGGVKVDDGFLHCLVYETSLESRRLSFIGRSHFKMSSCLHHIYLSQLTTSSTKIGAVATCEVNKALKKLARQ